MTVQSVPDDPMYQDHFDSYDPLPDPNLRPDPDWNPPHDYQWNLKKINAGQAWDIGTGSEEVIVAVIDSGIDFNHPDLAEINLLKGYSYLYPGSPPIDERGHGTHVTGIIAAATGNQQGIAGLNWRLSILPLQVFSWSGSGNMDNVAVAIEDATNWGARIINLSGSVTTYQPEPPQTLKDALDYALGRDVLVVVSAGNSSNEVLFHGDWPAAYEPVLTVSATEQSDQLSAYSNFGEEIDLAAPGGSREQDVVSLRAALSNYPGWLTVGDHYLRLSGTSMAAPLISGLAALILAKDNSLAAQEVENVMKNSAFDLGGLGFDSEFGYGRIDAARALQEMDTHPVVKPVISLPENLRIAKKLTVKGTATGDDFDSYLLEYAAEGDSDNWQTQGIHLNGNGDSPIFRNVLGTWELPTVAREISYLLRLTIRTVDGRDAQVTKRLVYDPRIRSGWPFLFKKYSATYPYTLIPHVISNISDLDEDGKKETAFFDQHRGYILKENGEAYPGWGSFYIGAGPWENITYAPVTIDVDPDLLGKEVAFGYINFGYAGYPRYAGSMAIRALSLQQSPDFSVFHSGFDYNLSRGSNESLVALVDNTRATLGFVFASSLYSSVEGNQLRVHRINTRGEEIPGWPVVPIALLQGSWII